MPHTQKHFLEKNESATRWKMPWNILVRSRSTVAPPQLFFDETAGFETSSWPYLRRHGAPCHPYIIVRYSFANKNNIC